MKDVPKRPNGLEKRGKHWRYRRTIPVELVPLIGRTAFTKSFKTSDYQEALKKYPLALIEADNVISAAARKLKLLQNEQARADGVLHIDSLTTEEIQSIVLSWFHKLESEFAPNAEQYIGDPVAEGDVVEGLKADLEALQSSQGIALSNDWVEKETDKLLSEHNIQIDKDTGQYSIIQTLVRRGLVESRERRLKAFIGHSATDGYYSGIEHVSPLPEMVQRNSPRAKVTVDGLLKKYLAEKDVAQKTRLQYEQHAGRFSEYVGHNRAIDTIGRDDFVAYRALLKEIPSNAAKRFPGLTFEQITKLPEAKKYSPLHPRTINKTFESLSTLFGFAEDWQLILKNPARKLQLPVDEDDEENDVRPYTFSELNTLFDAPLYRGCIDDERNYSKPGDSIVRKHRFWIPLIALYSGMRLNEICQLYVEDIKNEDGVDYIFIREKLDNGKLAEDKSLKNTSANRKVPIHSELKRFGLLEYLREVRRKKATRLFPDLSFASNGYSDSFQKWYRRFLISVGLKVNGRALCFHSFRHTFRDRLREAEVFPEYYNRLCGWTESQSTAKDYGGGVSITKYAEQIEKVEYPNLDLSHLYLNNE